MDNISSVVYIYIVISVISWYFDVLKLWDDEVFQEKGLSLCGYDSLSRPGPFSQKSLNGLFSLLNIRHPKKLRPSAPGRPSKLLIF